MRVVFTSTDPDNRGMEMLVGSLNHHGWDHCCLIADWQGYGTKLKALANYLRRVDDEEFIMLDAFDTFAVGGTNEWEMHTERIIIGGRMVCQPHEWKSNYFIHASPWRFVDSGMVYGRSKYFLKLYDETPFPEYDDDAIWWTMQAIKGKVDVDVKCKVFQNIAEPHRDIEFNPGERRVINRTYMTRPIFVHGNGGANMDKIYRV